MQESTQATADQLTIMETSNENIITFQDSKIDLSREYGEARRLMGLKTTDLEKLQSSVMHVYITIPRENQRWVDAFVALINELEDRQNMIMRMKLDKVLAA